MFRVSSCFSSRRVLSAVARQQSTQIKGELVRTVVKDGVGWIYLSDPSRLNALTVAMGEQFMCAVDTMVHAANSGDIRSCIVTGDGDAFSAGGDLNWLRARHHCSSAYSNSKTMVDFYKRFLSVHRIPVPTIAAINGAAIGAGLCMTLACDFRLASDNAKLGFTFAKLGIHPGMGCSTLLPRLVGQEYATLLLATGRIINSTTAAERGLILESVSTQGMGEDECASDRVCARALKLAEELNAGAPIAVQGVVQTLRNAKFDGLFDTLLWREADSQAVAYSSKDFARGLDAVVAKVVPKFEGY
jgi:enoyl-CoA hydratase/carnithine racemase